MNQKTRQIILILMILTMLLVVGTTGYMVLEDLNFINALYMTVITLSTVGFREVVDLRPETQVFTIFIIFAGISTAAYAFTNLAAFLLEGEFSYVLRRRSMDKKIAKLKDHYILCGAGQTGSSVIARFQRSKVDFVVIEKNEEKVHDMVERGILAIHGDATTEDALEKVRIRQAKGLISSLATDADNVFTVLTAREMKEDLYIVARAISKNAHVKLLRAGADNAVSPNELGGTRMASMLLRPVVVSFLDIITHMGDVVLDLEEVYITDKSDLADTTLEKAKIPERTGLNVLAIKKKDEEKLRLNPTSQEKIHAGDKLLVLGQEYQIDKLREMAG
ncbi:potassium channel family protein [Dethiobacter alkaliphilus]|uniref:potassium channel family protein n=1 Tax=Dethiobacter alkaliphilus TaxID=427926 RepID=UPI00222763C4|nr:potassium channel protein [Dethiobacter alkaliphilus]MCW3490992.1 potassium channel protein [Dethiobacter alkaliphilus]